MVKRLRVMEKKLTNSGPLRESVDKHSYLLFFLFCPREAYLAKRYTSLIIHTHDAFLHLYRPRI